MPSPRNSQPTLTDVTIDRIVGDGKGIGFADGKTYFVHRTAPGDHVRARVTRQQKNTAHAVVDKIYTPSPLRIEPACPYYDRCGGCDLMHIEYAHQLDTKVGMIQDSLRRIAKIDDVPNVPIMASPKEWGYRSRVEWQVSAENDLVGYFAEQSNTIVDVDQCPISNDTVNALLKTLRADVDAGIVPDSAREYRGVATDTGNALEPTTTKRSATLQQQVGEFTYRFSAECFFQANLGMTEVLLKDVMQIAMEARSGKGYVVDLYAGVGLFSLPLFKLFRRGIAVESFKPAVGFLKDNLEHAELTRSKVIAQPVEHWVARDNSRYGRVALLVFDPPRSGAGPKAIEGILRMSPTHIAAVSCDPATFARDLRGLLDGGYELVDITAYDMFPQTHHVELLAHLRRKESDDVDNT